MINIILCYVNVYLKLMYVTVYSYSYMSYEKIPKLESTSIVVVIINCKILRLYHEYMGCVAFIIPNF